ncbi:Non-repetitive/WGA-negative nucleoporin C-terminal-domain-containing protein, partial [Echria macrotheca]
MNPATPVRQIPGAYFNTPAPGANTAVRRRLNFNEPAVPAAIAGPDAANHPDNAVAALAGPETGPERQEMAPLTKAAASINQTLQADESYPDLDSYCRLGASSEYDIQLPQSACAPFAKGNMYTIPDQILNKLNNGEVVTKIGLFANIGYAWASVDSSVFLWDYSHPQPDLVGFEDAGHIISAVALVPPKPGVFVKTITHILVIATTADIILLGVSAEPTPSGSRNVTLYQTKMSVHRGGSDVSWIEATESGRIFFGGLSDTDIYELFYQQEERWFSSRCGKINHTSPGWSSVVPSLPVPGFGAKPHEHLVGIYIDNTRNLLYSLSSNSTIRTYYMDGPDKLTKVIEKDKFSCLRDMTHLVDGRSSLLNDQTQIVSLSPISATETSKLHLMAITNTGCRLFLSATSAASYIIGAASSAPPQSMQVQFIKFPPRTNAQGRRDGHGQAQETRVNIESRELDHSRFGYRFAPGYFFDVVPNASDPNMDELFVSAPDTGRIKITSPASTLTYFEQGTRIPLDRGKAEMIGMTTPPFAAASQPMGFGNELAVQFDHPPSEFAILTNSGIFIVHRRRLVDMLAATLREVVQGANLESLVRYFISLYGRKETMSAALAVACGQGSGRAADQQTEDLARKVFVDFGGQPRLAETDGDKITADSVELSSRHDALALYLTRLIRMLWKSKVVTVKVEKAAFVVTSTISRTKLTAVQENVERLRNFLEANKGVIQGLVGPPENTTNRQEEIAFQKEHQALRSLRLLMESVSEGISFVLMLFDERVSEIFARLDATAGEQLKALTYESLFSRRAGKELAKVLVKAIVNRNIASGANVETVADALRRRCGSFCSPEDVVIFKAQEQLQRAAEQAQNGQNPSAIRTLLAESLRLFEQVARDLSTENLRAAVEQYVELKYYAGAIQLCLRVARERDRRNVALSWVNDGKPEGDWRCGSFVARDKCYNLIYEVLDRLETAFAQEPETIDGRPTLAATKRMEAYAVVNDSDDEVFHFELYDWYIEKNWTDRLLAIDSPHVITYLQRLASTELEHADLLCRFYTHRSRFFEAAQVQAELAKSELNIGIKERISLLSRAKGNASVNTLGISRQQQQELNHEVTELLEIAHIQHDLLERLKNDERISPEKLPDIEEALDGPIKGLTELFNDYADQAGYYDLSLLIFHAADYQNSRTISETWENLITDVHNNNEQRQLIWQQQEAGQLPADVEPLAGEPGLPYEAVSTAIRNIAHRTSLDSLIFPVDVLLPLVCRYAVLQGQDATIGADPRWPVMLFLHLGLPHALIVHVLEEMFEAQEAPFTGRRRKVVVQWISTAVDAWVREIQRRGKGVDTAIGAGVSGLLASADESMAQLSQGTRNQAELEELAETRRDVRSLKREVDSIIGAAELQGSLF